ncbi:MAG TPA: DUF378 domain-containing protein [Candidatus Saccharimonadales bacterium]
MDNLNAVDWIAIILVVVGALNWGLIGATKWNLVEAIFGDESALSRAVYIVVGISGLYLIFLATHLTKSAGS